MSANVLRVAKSLVVGISMDAKALKRLDRLAKSEGVSRSGMVRVLTERAEADGSVPDVRVDGRRFVPESS